MGSSTFCDIPCPWGGAGQNEGLRNLCHISTLLSTGHPCFTNTCLVYSPERVPLQLCFRRFLGTQNVHGGFQRGKKCARLSKVFCRWWTPTFSESGSVKREYWISDKIDRAITMSRKIIRAYREVVYANTVRGLSLSSPKHNRRVLLLFICNDRYTVRGEKKHIHACMSILKQIYRHSFQFQANHWNLTMPNR